MPEKTELEIANEKIAALEDYVVLVASVYDFQVDGDVDPILKDAIKADYVRTRICHLADSIKLKREIEATENERLAEDPQIN